MSQTRSLILLLLLASSLISCRYGFLPEGTEGGRKIALDPSTNKTHLREAGIVLDSFLEQSFASMGMISNKDAKYRLTCSMVSSSRETITSITFKNREPLPAYRQCACKLKRCLGQVPLAGDLFRYRDLLRRRPGRRCP